MFALFVSDMRKDFLVVHTAEGLKKLLDIFQRLFKELGMKLSVTKLNAFLERSLEAFCQKIFGDDE